MAKPLSLEGIIVLQPQIYEDDRGHFYESYNQKKFQELTGLNLSFVQDNHSRSSKGVLRGLHYQLPPKGQGKLIRVIHGEILDVVVDIRKSSANFGKWISLKLNHKNKKLLWIPEGFAHGFETLSNTAEVVYKTTEYYSSHSERSIRWDDSDLAIEWTNNTPNISAKDKNGVFFRNAEVFL